MIVLISILIVSLALLVVLSYAYAWIEDREWRETMREYEDRWRMEEEEDL